jgi:Leucine-rich repeat (LRR) protein
MFYFPKLISLDLSYNLFERLPIELLLYKKLETLNVEGNLSLVSPPLDLCLQGKEVIFTELQKAWLTDYVTDPIFLALLDIL